MNTRRNRLSGLDGALLAGSLALLGAALVRELRTPEADRTWQGRLLGIPYDLRAPTPSRLRAAFWAPEDPRVLTPRPAGIGWGINVGRLVRGRR